MTLRPRGLETEYGLQVRVRPLDGGVAGPLSWRRLSSDEAARALFEPVVEANAATNVFLRNGGRLYLDVGSHPEYATAECTTLAELVAQDRAGDLVLAQLAARTRERLLEQGLDSRVSIFKNNVDSHGNSYGSHENFQVARTGSLEQMVDALVPFLVTRQLICGAGHWERDRLGRGRFLMSQRAAHMWDPLGSATTRSRPMVNTRDEPHADAERFRRLHVIVGDSTMLDHSTLLRVGSMELVLRAVESGERFADLAVGEAGQVIREVSADLTGRCPVTTRGADALSVQRACWQRTGDCVDGDELGWVHRLWGQVLDALEGGEPERMAASVDWIAKRRLLLAQQARHGMREDDPRLAQLDLAWHDIVPAQGLARLAERRGQVARWLPEGADQEATARPPSSTRALVRAAFITAAQRHRREYQVDWMRFTCHDLPDGQVAVSDALTTHDDGVEELIRRMASEPRRAASSTFASSRLPWTPSQLG
ncbi:proteasome accessory factor PafA2 family protein [Luteococcus sp. Sow4_B9]|uniref:proteasome accessory factor PafA2 family protein n=1 Tax=Luteococcus sp. Sow4_B9 TaxID=3438792 RepID=UPI003F9791FF